MALEMSANLIQFFERLSLNSEEAIVHDQPIKVYIPLENPFR